MVRIDDAVEQRARFGRIKHRRLPRRHHVVRPLHHKINEVVHPPR
jgi:hypothetical protein